MKIIAFSGKSGAGKDYRARVLQHAHGFDRLAFADPIKEICRERFGFTESQLFGDEKDSVDPRLGIAPREAFQRVGEFYRSFDEDYWAHILSAKIDRKAAAGRKRIVVTDLRRMNEMASLENAVGRHSGDLLTVRIENPESFDHLSQHVSETELDGYEGFSARLDRLDDPQEAARRALQLAENFLFEEKSFPRVQTALPL